jgi:hypothetical protein
VITTRWLLPPIPCPTPYHLPCTALPQYSRTRRSRYRCRYCQGGGPSEGQENGQQYKAMERTQQYKCEVQPVCGRWGGEVAGWVRGVDYNINSEMHTIHVLHCRGQHRRSTAGLPHNSRHQRMTASSIVHTR